jgi:hypothetical protein
MNTWPDRLGLRNRPQNDRQWGGYKVKGSFEGFNVITTFGGGHINRSCGNVKIVARGSCVADDNDNVAGDLLNPD